MKIRPSGRTDKYDEVNSRFSQFYETRLQSSIIRKHNCLRANFRVVDGKGTARGTDGKPRA